MRGHFSGLLVEPRRWAVRSRVRTKKRAATAQDYSWRRDFEAASKAMPPNESKPIVDGSGIALGTIMSDENNEDESLANENTPLPSDGGAGGGKEAGSP